MSTDILRRNNVRTFGTGDQVMLFAHGFGCDQHMWRFITPAFEQHYRIVLFDYVGSGKSDLAAYTSERYCELNGYAQDILDICETLNLTNVILVAHSVSTMIGILAAIRAPHYFKQLILVCPSPRYLNDSLDYIGGFERADIEELLMLMDKNYIGWASMLAPLIMQNAGRPELASELEHSFCSTDPITARQFAEVTFFSDNREDLSKLTTPALILQCAEDAIAPQQVGHYLHQHIAQSTLHLMQATGHCPHMSHPTETIASISSYLAAVHN